LSAIEIKIMTGPGEGKTLKLNESPITFGRTGQNTLIIDMPFISRTHGELVRDEAGNWTLVNRSRHGTRVGPTKVLKKPYAIKQPEAICVGRHVIFLVTPEGMDRGPDPLSPESRDERRKAAALEMARAQKRKAIALGVVAGVIVLAAAAAVYLWA